VVPRRGLLVMAPLQDGRQGRRDGRHPVGKEKLRGLEVTFAWLNEAREIARPILAPHPHSQVRRAAAPLLVS
jgi:hypothetical protein